MQDGQIFNPNDLRWEFYPTPIWISIHPNLTPGAKSVYGLLMKSAGKDGNAFPSQQKLAEILCCSIRQIQRRICELKNAELIKITKTQKSHKYEFMYSQGDIDVVLETKSQGDTDVVLEKSQGDTGVVSIKDNIKEKVKKSNLKVTHTFSDENVQGGDKSLIKVNSNELDLLTLFYTSIGKKMPDKKTKKLS